MYMKENFESSKSESSVEQFEDSILSRFGERGPRALALAAALAGMTSACTTTSVGTSMTSSSFGKLGTAESYCDDVDHLVGKEVGSSDTKVIRFPDGTALVQGFVDQSGNVVATVESMRPDGSKYSIDCNFQ